MARFEAYEGFRRFNEVNIPYDQATKRLPETDYLLSRTIATTWDLISEGPIEGLVSGEYTFEGNAGDVGYSSYTFTPFNDVEYENGSVSFTVPGYLRSLYWNQTPILNKNNQVNFQTINVIKTNGEPNGKKLESDGRLGDEANLRTTRPIGERLRASSENIDYSKYYKILNPNCTEVRVNFRLNQLVKVISSGDNAGDIHESSVNIDLRYRPIWSPKKENAPSEWSAVIPTYIMGKISSPSIFSSRIRFSVNVNAKEFYNDPNFLGWEIKITRTTPDSDNQDIRNQTFVDSITEINDLSFTYPNCAMVKSVFNAEFFSQVPQRAFDCKLLKVKIPSNYNPILRSYDGDWDGTFKDEKYWTDNPAWCYYDLLTNKRYGLGTYIDESYVDKWTLYQISKYCDTLVPDGKGGVEPRFSCNVYISSREDAFKVVNDMASVFRGIAYYGFGSVYTIQDKPKEAIVQFTNANVENGDFTYMSTSKSARHTVAKVTWNDPNNFFKSTIDYVEDIESIRKYGIREMELAGFGCTSQGQAIRLGRWAILSELLETETVSFVAGLEGVYLRPGDVFKIFDSNKKSRRTGGRVYSYQNYTTGSIITLDSTVALGNQTQYSFSLMTPTYSYDANQVTDLTSVNTGDIRRSQIQKRTFSGLNSRTVSGRTEIVFEDPFDTDSYDFVHHPVWTIELESGSQTIADNEYFINENSDYYRVIRIEEKDDNRYAISALQYSAQKYLEVESGLSFQRTSAQINTRPLAPSNLILTNSTDDSRRYLNYSFLTTSLDGLDAYKVYIKKDAFSSAAIPAAQYLSNELPFDITHGSYYAEETGNYYVRVYAYNNLANLFSTDYVEGSATITSLSTGEIQSIYNLTIGSLMVVEDTGVFDTTTNVRTKNVTLMDPTFTWQYGLRDEMISPGMKAFRLTIREPSLSPTPSDVIYYENTGIDASQNEPEFTFSFDDINNSDDLRALGGPFRAYDVVVEGIDANGYTSAGNRVFSSELREENGWGNFPGGYDIINVNNPRPTGFDISSGETHPEGYRTSQYYSPDWTLVCPFSGASEELPQDIAGCFAYFSFSRYSSLDAQTGKAGISKVRGSFDNTLNIATFPNAFHMPPRKSGFFAISLFDEFDQEVYGSDNSFSTGLYVSNVAPIMSRANVSDLTIAGEDDKNYKLVTRKVDGGFVELVLIDSEDESNVIILN